MGQLKRDHGRRLLLAVATLLIAAFGNAENQQPTGDREAPVDTPERQRELDPQDYSESRRGSARRANEARRMVEPHSEPEDALLFLPRTLLFLPNLALRTVFLPIRYAAVLIDGGYWHYGIAAAGFTSIFRDSRVLSLRVVLEAVRGDDADIPFTELVRLGGPERLRGYGLDRFRDEIALLGTIEYRYLCAIDLSVRFGIVTSGLVEALDARDDVVFAQQGQQDGSICIPIHQDDQYRIYRLRIVRYDRQYPAMRVHFKGGRRARLFGIERLER